MSLGSIVGAQILQVSRSSNLIDFILCDQFGKHHKLTVSSVYGPLNVSLDGATLLQNQQIDLFQQRPPAGNKRKSEAGIDSGAKRSKQSHREKRPREPLTIESDWR